MSLRTFGGWDTPGMKLVVEASAKGPTALTGQAAIPVGALPAGWTRRRLGDLGRPYGGLAGKTGADFGRGSARYITFLNVMTNPVIDPRLFEPVVVRSYERQNEARKGDLFFNGSSETPEEVAMCSLLYHDVNGVYLNSFCFGFRLDDPDVDGLYLVNFFRSHEGRKLVLPLAQGFTRHNLSKRALLNVSIPVPPLGEQRAICRALTGADHFIQELDRLIAKKRAIKHGTIQALTTGRLRLPGFSEPWGRKTLGRLGTFSRGTGLSKAELLREGSLPAIPYTAIYTDFDQVIERSRIGYYTSEFGGARVVATPCLLIAGASNVLENIGKAAAYCGDGPVAVGGDVVIYQTAENVAFLSFLLSTAVHRRRIVSMSQGITIRHVYPSTFCDYEVQLPTRAEQDAVVDVLLDMRGEIEALGYRREKAREMREGMAQALLSGRVRLTEPKPRADAS